MICNTRKESNRISVCATHKHKHSAKWSLLRAILFADNRAPTETKRWMWKNSKWTGFFCFDTIHSPSGLSLPPAPRSSISGVLSCPFASEMRRIAAVFIRFGCETVRLQFPVAEDVFVLAACMLGGFLFPPLQRANILWLDFQSCCALRQWYCLLIGPAGCVHGAQAIKQFNFRKISNE